MWRFRSIITKPHLKDTFVLSLTKNYTFLLEQKGPAYHKDAQEYRELLRDAYWSDRDLDKPVLGGGRIFAHLACSVIGLGLCFSAMSRLIDCYFELCSAFLLKKSLFQLWLGYSLGSESDRSYQKAITQDQQRQRILVLLEEAAESRVGEICEKEHRQNGEGYDEARIGREIFDQLERERAKLMSGRILGE